MRRHPRVRVLALLSALLFLPAACSFGEPATEEELPPAFGMFPLSTTSAEVQAEVVRVHHAFDMSRITDAREHARRIIELDPMYAYGYLLAAWAAPSSAEYRSNLRRAVENAGSANDVERALIEAEQKAFDSDPEGALAIEQELAASDAQNPLFQLVLALRLSGMNRADEARAAASRAIELAPDYVGAISWLGLNYTQQQPTNFEEAERLLRRAIELDPDEPFSHDYLADVHRQQGRFEEAIAGYTRAAELDPDEQGFVGQRGHVYSFMNDYAAARADYEAAAAQASRRGGDQAGDAVWWNRQVAYTHLYEADVDAALERLATAVAMADALTASDRLDQLIEANFDVMLVAGHHGRLDVARAAHERFAALVRQQAADAGTPEAATNAENGILIQGAFLDYRAGDYAAVRAKAQESMRLMADMLSPRRFEGAHVLLAYAALGEGRYAESVEHFAQTDPNNTYHSYYHAMALERAGRVDEAMALYRRVADFRFSNLSPALVKPLAQQRVAAAGT